MRIFYVDESGTGIRDKASNFFLLAALSLDVVDIPRVDREISVLKRELVSWAKPEDFEIKGRDIRRGDKIFSSLSWEDRVRAIRAIAESIAQLPCRATTVSVDKRALPEYIGTDADLYRVGFWRLLDELNSELGATGEPGMILLDARSDLHHSVQDRRLIDVYRDWASNQYGTVWFAELPWFGFSAFYAGLQLADFLAYLTDSALNHGETMRFRMSELLESYSLLEHKVRSLRIP